jgi:hypothetical protein
VRVALNPADLERIVRENRQNLRELLAYETEALRLKERAGELLDQGADRVRPLIFPELEFFQPVPEGEMRLTILDEGRGWDLWSGKREGSRTSPSAVGIYGVNIAYAFLLLGSLLAAVLFASGFLGNAAQAAIWVQAAIREPGRCAESPVRNALAALVLLLTAGALAIILQNL